MGRPDPADHMKTYAGLDTVRAIASLCVLVTHVSFWAGWYQQDLMGRMSARLDIGVAIFFVLSGFLLGRPFLSALAAGRRSPRAGRYFWKRSLRIVPLYVATVVIALLALEQNRGLGVVQWIRQLTLTQVYPDGLLVAGLTHMWSLCVEVAFYVALPVIAWVLVRVVCRSRWSAGRLLVALGALSVVSWAWLIWVAPRVDGSNLWLPAYLSWFAVGLAIAVADIEIARTQRWRWLTDLAAQPGVCWTIALAAFAVTATPLAGPILLEQPTESNAVIKNLMYAIAAGLVVLPSVLGPQRGTVYADVMAWRPFRHVGHISYGIFCLHLLVLHAVSDLLDIPLFSGQGWTLLGATVLGSLVAAEVTYRLVERPALRLKDSRIGRRRKPTPATSPSEHSTSS